MSKPLGPYSPVVRAGDFIIVSGQGGMADGKVVEGGVAAETTQTMKNVAMQLESMGASLTDIVKTTCFLADMDDFKAFNEVYGRFFPEPYPARTTIQAARLPLDIDVEIEAIAKRR